MNITIPKDLAERLKRVPNKSAFIAEALREKLASDEGGTLLASAYREASCENARVAGDWDALSGEGIP
ncbi:MAG: ribbon-helix-helix domain-containing protein [Elusimicrobiota bacterium]